MGFFQTALPRRAIPRPALLVQLTRVERKLDLILEHLGVEAPEDDGLDLARHYLEKGWMVQAIKEYRERTGAGPAEAKAAVYRGL